jgi:arsenate reductase
MAEAFTNRLEVERGIAVRALSAGTAAGARINPAAEQAMAEIGIAMDGQTPRRMTQEVVAAASIPIAAVPIVIANRRTWYA